MTEQQPGDVRQVIGRLRDASFGACEKFDHNGGAPQPRCMTCGQTEERHAFRTAADLLATQSAEVERSWRCFHCGEVFTTEREASEHFGTELPFGQETPACIEVLTTGEKALVVEVRAAREEAQRTAAENDLLGQQIAGFEASLRQRFKGAASVHDAFNLYDSMEGRALAAEERAEKAEADVEALRAELSGVKANWELDQRVLDRLRRASRRRRCESRSPHQPESRCEFSVGHVGPHVFGELAWTDASPPAPSGWQPDVVQLVAEALRPFAEIGALLFARPHVPDTDVMVELRGINGQRGGLTRGQFKAAHEARQRLTESAELAPSGWQQRIAAMDPWTDANRWYACHFCGAEKTWDGVREVFVEQPHEADCLWQNAKDALPPSSEDHPFLGPLTHVAEVGLSVTGVSATDPGEDALPPAPEAWPAKEGC